MFSGHFQCISIFRKSYHEPTDTEDETDGEEEKKPYPDFNIIEHEEEVTPLENHYYKDAFIPPMNTISYISKSMQNLENQNNESEQQQQKQQQPRAVANPSNDVRAQPVEDTSFRSNDPK